jgi:hypothetical protein
MGCNDSSLHRPQDLAINDPLIVYPNDHIFLTAHDLVWCREGDERLTHNVRNDMEDLFLSFVEENQQPRRVWVYDLLDLHDLIGLRHGGHRLTSL